MRDIVMLPRISPAAGRPTSVAAAALSDRELRKTRIAAAAAFVSSATCFHTAHYGGTSPPLGP
jgi:hypothetical protein